MNTSPGSLTRYYRVVVKCQACGFSHVRNYPAPRKETGSEMTIAAPCPTCKERDGQYKIMSVRRA